MVKRAAPAHLQALILSGLEAAAMSRSELARRAGISPQAVSTLISDRAIKAMPLPATIVGLARGLGVAEEAIVTACLRDLGLRLSRTETDDPAVAVILAAARAMNAAERAQLARIAQTFIAQT